ncbi:uncharacterized protein LOC127812107 isoform X1 [Diospyros lotus]|uniref:uncharacterized protein LOC127812107 isoform X1 n=1 Tax=Diospyros lotus TaxID=55363 RepID=UPI0022572BBC|nr:uncharacterized protein LOC127812107 isoform X1 [Diospyros lotus]
MKENDRESEEKMGDQAEANRSSEALDIDAIRSRIKELRDVSGGFYDAPGLAPSDSEQLLKDCAFQLESKISQVLSEFSGVGSLPVEDIDTYWGRVKEELNNVEAENAKLSSEIEDLMRTYIEDSNQLESELEGLNCSLDFVALQGIEKTKTTGHVDCSFHEEVEFLKGKTDYKFKMLELSDQIEKNRVTLQSLEDLDCILKRFEAIEKIEDALTGLKVLEHEGNCIRLSLRTYIPNSESILSQHKIEDFTEPLEQNHELLIQVSEGTLELKNVEIFPNDVYVGEIIEAAKSFRQSLKSISILESRSSLEWFVRRVQEKIVLSTLRRLLVKFANKSRQSVEYIDKEDIIVAHMVGGVDAFIKISQGWPASNHALKLISLKSSDHHSKEISLRFLCKVEEMANSLDAHIRQNISSFVDAIEEILVQQMRIELQPDNGSEN